MTGLDEAREELRRAFELVHAADEPSLASAAEAIETALHKLAEVTPAWVPVTERLPEENVDVLVALLCADVGEPAWQCTTVGYRYGANTLEHSDWELDWEGADSYQVTHWAPIPALPAAKEGS